MRTKRLSISLRQQWQWLLCARLATSAHAASHKTLCQGVFGNTLQPYVLESFFAQFLWYKRFCKNQNNIERDGSLPLKWYLTHSLQSQEENNKSLLLVLESALQPWLLGMLRKTILRKWTIFQWLTTVNQMKYKRLVIKILLCHKCWLTMVNRCIKKTIVLLIVWHSTFFEGP